MKKIDEYFKRSVTKPPQEAEPCSSSFSESPTASTSSLSSTKSSCDPPYPDIGTMKEADLSNHETKINLLQKTWDSNQYTNYSFPAR